MSSIPASQLSSGDLSALACTYAALVLHDDNQQLSAAKIATLVKSANVSIEKFWPGLFAKSLEGRNISDLLLPSAGGAAPVAAAASGAAAATEAPKEEPKKEEEEEEGDFDMGGMFE